LDLPTKRHQSADFGTQSPEIVPNYVPEAFAHITQRDDGFWTIGWHDDAPVPFEFFPFALAVAAQRVSA
jgi:hypothetical protein